MTRTSLKIVAPLLLALTVAALVAAPQARAATLASQLRSSEAELAKAKVEYARMVDLLSAALSGQRRGLAPLGLQFEKARHAYRFWQAVVADLRARQARQQRAVRAASPSGWKELIGDAARRNGVSADGLYRLMVMESGGHAGIVGSGMFYGLYQYSLHTWRGDWNPWRGVSVFDGAAQIKATALAVRRGMGRALWPNTYGSAF